MSKPKIIIVGAGPAGIAAATRLIENGFSEITVLEAENRIGGRVNSVEFGGSIVDLGGTWIHGEKGNIVYEMLQKKGLLNLIGTSFNNYQDNTYYLSNGKPLDKSITDRLFKIGMSVWDDEEEAKKHPGTFGDYFTKVYGQKINKEFEGNTEILKIAPIFQDWIHKFFLCLDSTTSWYEVSNIGPYAFQSCEGDQQLNWKDQGYRTILYIMMKKIPDITQQLPMDDKILINKEVNKIVWSNNSANKDGVTVNCSDGTSYNADHVIVTVSVGVLKSLYKNLFVPELPSFKTNAIEGISFGTVNKILLKFPTKWWPDDLKGFSLLWTEEDRKNFRNEFPHGPHDNGRSWLDDVYGFYVIDSHPRVLLGWVVGKMAKAVEDLPDDIVRDGCMLLLKKFVGRKYKVSQPDEILRTKWGTNPHFCGSYVHVSLEQEKRQVKAEDLEKPLASENDKQTLLFAGEGTNPTKFSTVHGAIETGYREADRIINIYKSIPKNHHKVVIVGAGIAGLGAALKLQESGLDDFIIVEAQETAGGRIKSIEVNNKPLELGAQWLHGKDNPIYELVSKHDMLSEDLSEEGLGLYIRNDGVIFDSFLVKRVNFEVGVILEECQKFLQNCDYPKSLYEFLHHRFRKYVQGSDDPKEIQEMKFQLLDWHERFQIVDNSCRDLKRLSAKYWGKYECLDDVAHYNLKFGYMALVNLLIDRLPSSRLFFNTEVRKIEYDSSKVVVTCNDKTIYCDHLILTVSLGVLKEFSEIYPPLPNPLSSAIKNMGFDKIGKIFLFFDRKWWPSGGVQFLWTEEINLDPSNKWLRTLTGFEELFSHENALLGWVGSEGVDKMENMSEDEVGNACMLLLRMFLPEYDIPQPVQVFRTQWNSNPWIKGSYCHITPECDESDSGIEKLGEPVVVEGVPRILLAGEAVHQTHYSTVHGAYESGQQQAQLLLDYISELGKDNIHKVN